MSKDYYSGAPRKTSGTRRGTRGRILRPDAPRVERMSGGQSIPQQADDELSNLLVDADVIVPRQQRALSNIRDYVQGNAGTLHRKLVRSGESDVDAGNAIRGRLGRRLVPETFTMRGSVRGRGNMGTLGPGSQVRVRRVHSEGQTLKWDISGKTEGGRNIGQTVDDADIGGLIGG